MNTCKTLRMATLAILAILAALSSVPAMAQEDEHETRQREHEVQRELREREREIQRDVVDIEVEMREAETRLAEAARRVAELSTRRLPGGYWTMERSGKPVLGITIGAPDDAMPVEGVEILGVSPGGAASDAGLRAGDVITAVNGETLSADSSQSANDKLLDFMKGVEDGDVIDVEYLRAGKSANAEVAPRVMSSQVFAFGGPDTDVHVSVPPVAPVAPAGDVNRFVFVTGGRGWGDLEMVALTENLGRYFGTESGLLVVRAPEDDSYQLRDGDVILNIDGREPNSVSHAIRILASYQEGESLKLRIMRDKRPQTLEIEMPDNRRGAVYESFTPRVRSEIRVAPKVEVRVDDDPI